MSVSAGHNKLFQSSLNSQNRHISPSPTGKPSLRLKLGQKPTQLPLDLSQNMRPRIHPFLTVLLVSRSTSPIVLMESRTSVFLSQDTPSTPTNPNIRRPSINTLILHPLEISNSASKLTSLKFSIFFNSILKLSSNFLLSLPNTGPLLFQVEFFWILDLWFCNIWTSLLRTSDSTTFGRLYRGPLILQLYNLSFANLWFDKLKSLDSEPLILQLLNLFKANLSSAKCDSWNSGPLIPDADEFPIPEPLNLRAGLPVWRESLEAIPTTTLPTRVFSILSKAWYPTIFGPISHGICSVSRTG